MLRGAFTLAVGALALLAGCGRAEPEVGPALSAATAGPGIWYAPRDAAEAGHQVAEQAAGDVFADECARYLADQAMHLRCQWITGPDKSEVVPLIGLGASLDEQMRCHPLRDDPPAYRACLARES